MRLISTKSAGRGLFELSWLDRFLSYLPTEARILDLGCGMAEPIAAYLIGQGARLTGIDASPSLIALCQQRYPDHDWRVGDMRELNLSQSFDGIIAWHSLFHLTQAAQIKVLQACAKLTRTGGVLMFTSGVVEGVAIGQWHEKPLFHASLSTVAYQTLLAELGFEVIQHVINDASCGQANIWLALKK